MDIKFKFVVLKINNHMSQEELLVLIYKMREHLHLYDMYSKSLFSVISVLVKKERKQKTF
jgi:hypothetical protein